MDTVSDSLLQRFADKVHSTCPDFPAGRKKGMVRCPFHVEKIASCSIDIERGVFHCFGCGAHGGVKRFYELLGEPWFLARQETPTRRTHRIALAAAQNEFKLWEQCAMIQVTDRYREVLQEVDIARIAYQATLRCPDLYTAEEKRFWRWKFAELTDVEQSLAQLCDLFTYPQHRQERLELWAAVTQQTECDEGAVA